MLACYRRVAFAFWGVIALAPAVPAAEAQARAQIAGGQAAFVRVSPRDSRYFELSDGRAYIPIGLNLAVSPTGVKLGVSRVGALGDYERWFRRLSENRGNFARIWLSSATFDVEHAQSGQYDEDRAKRIDDCWPLRGAMAFASNCVWSISATSATARSPGSASPCTTYRVVVPRKRRPTFLTRRAAGSSFAGSSPGTSTAMATIRSCLHGNCGTR